MSKEKFNIGNLGLPAKPVVVKNPQTEMKPIVERAVEAIHKPKQAEEPATTPPSVRKISLDLPVDMFKFIKLHCVEHDITMREFIVGILEKDISARKGK